MIKIRLAIIDDDLSYAQSISFSLNAKYGSNIEVYTFDSVEKLNAMINDIKVDVVLLDQKFDDKELMLKNISVGYLCSSNEISMIKDKKAVSKYQKIDEFYKSLLNLYSDVMPTGMEIGFSDGKKPVVMFTSPAGGVGCSTLAVSYATRLARQGSKPLYLNLQLFGDTSKYFQAQGNQTFSDVIYALKSKKANLLLKMESSMKLSEQGVYFFDPCEVALDMLEMSASDYGSLIDALSSVSDIDVVVVDFNFSMGEKDLTLLKKATDIIVVSDGSAGANAKIQRMMAALSIHEKRVKANFVSRIRLFYNKFSSRTSTQIESMDYIGGIQRFEGFGISDIIKRISAMDNLDKI